MVDRQDIDALLIGALYGELTLADEARLTAHLESHPADRTALEGLTLAREAVRESRIFQVQLDPPQSVSALLLQEAARRAPRRALSSSGEAHDQGWFHRFVHSFMAHPAMAAAAMLVLVVGVAGTMYLRKGDQFANREVGRSELAGSAAPTMGAAGRGDSLDGKLAVKQTVTLDGEQQAKTPRADDNVAVNAGSAYGADLDDHNHRGDVRAAEKAGKDKADPAFAAAIDKRQRDDFKFAPSANKQDEPKKKPDSYLQVRTPEPAPKELDLAEGKKVVSKGKHEEASDDTIATTTTGIATGGNAGNGAPATPAKPAVAHTSPPSMSPPPPADVKSGDKTVAKPESQSNEALIAWAKEQHGRVKALARKGDCEEVGKLAVTISTRAPDYYAQNVAPDRELKQCMAYINNARNSDAEKTSKVRAQKRNSPNEPAPAQNDVK